MLNTESGIGPKQVSDLACTIENSIASKPESARIEAAGIGDQTDEAQSFGFLADYCCWGSFQEGATHESN
jgi:hypothetical protein